MLFRSIPSYFGRQSQSSTVVGIHLVSGLHDTHGHPDESHRTEENGIDQYDSHGVNDVAPVLGYILPAYGALLHSTRYQQRMYASVFISLFVEHHFRESACRESHDWAIRKNTLLLLRSLRGYDRSYVFYGFLRLGMAYPVFLLFFG